MQDSPTNLALQTMFTAQHTKEDSSIISFPAFLSTRSLEGHCSTITSSSFRAVYFIADGFWIWLLLFATRSLYIRRKWKTGAIPRIMEMQQFIN